MPSSIIRTYVTLRKTEERLYLQEQNYNKLRVRFNAMLVSFVMYALHDYANAGEHRDEKFLLLFGVITAANILVMSYEAMFK
jgi:hypothetical protein